MRIKHKPVAFLSGKGLAKKGEFAKRQAFYNRSHAAVFVVDSEGGHKELQAYAPIWKTAETVSCLTFAWPSASPSRASRLRLAAPEAIRRGLQLVATPQMPAEPEKTRAPCQNRCDNPKTGSARWSGRGDGELSAAERTKSPLRINDLEHLRAGCLLGFAPLLTK